MSSRPNLFIGDTRKRRSTTGRVVRGAAITVAVLVVLAIVVGLVLWFYARSQMNDVDVPSLHETLRPGQAMTDVEQAGTLPGTLNVLVIGNATREGLSPQELIELGTHDDGSLATDTIMMIQISPLREETVILSFPRDLQVQYEDRTVKINAVHVLGGGTDGGGPDALVRVVQELTGVPLHHYIEIDMAGFLQLADVLNGVEVCLDDPLVDRDAGISLPAGCQTLTAIDALGFVRSRQVETEQFGWGDFGRIAKQQYYIRQSMAQATELGTLLNPLRVKGLIDAVASAITTDRNLGLTDMYRIANTLKGMSADDVVMRTVPGFNRYENNLWYVIMETEEAEELFQSLRDGSDLGDVGTDPPRDMEPGDVSVLVVNGVGIEGLAGNMRTFLQGRGFVVTDALNPADLNPDDDFDPSMQRLEIRHTAQTLWHAEAVRDSLGTVAVELQEVDADELPEGNDVVVVVGSAWRQRTS